MQRRGDLLPSPVGFVEREIEKKKKRSPPRD